MTGISLLKPRYASIEHDVISGRAFRRSVQLGSAPSKERPDPTHDPPLIRGCPQISNTFDSL